MKYIFTDLFQYGYIPSSLAGTAGIGVCITKPPGRIGSAKEDLLAFPEGVVREVGHALYVAQMGAKHGSAKPLKGFGGASVFEIVEDHDGDTYRAVYMVRFAGVVYVLHAFQKTSKTGMATPRQQIERVKARLKRAQEEYKTWQSANP